MSVKYFKLYTKGSFLLFEESPHFSKELPFLFFMFLYIVKETNRIRVFLLFQILFKKYHKKSND